MAWPRFTVIETRSMYSIPAMKRELRRLTLSEGRSEIFKGRGPGREGRGEKWGGGGGG